MKRQYHGFRPLNPLNGIEAGPVRCMVYPLPVQKVPEIRCMAQQKNAIGMYLASVKQLNLFHGIVKLRMHTSGVPALFIFSPLAALIPRRYKIKHSIAS